MTSKVAEPTCIKLAKLMRSLAVHGNKVKSKRWCESAMSKGRIAQSHAPLKHEEIEEIETPGQGRAFASCPPDLERQVEGDPISSP